MHVQVNRLKGLQQDYGRGFDTEFADTAQYCSQLLFLHCVPIHSL